MTTTARNIRVLRQPTGSNLCGQTCVAMVTGVSIARVAQVMGKWGCTRTADLAKALDRYGFDTSGRLTRIPESPLSFPYDPTDTRRWHEVWGDTLNRHLPDLAIVSLRIVPTVRCHAKGHWVLWHDGRLIDPDLDGDNPHRSLCMVPNAFLSIGK